MAIVIVVVAMLVLVTFSVIIVSAGFRVHNRRIAGQYAAGKELALLADVRL